MFIRGGQTSDIVNNVLREVYLMKKPNAIMFNKKNAIRPFEDVTSLEFFSSKNDASLFLFGSHNKKRPHNIVIGHMYDYHILDMIEFGVENYTSMKEFKNAKLTTGSKPCLLFSGEPFNTDHTHKRLQTLLINFFRGPVVQNIRLAGLEHVISFTAIDGKIAVRSYKTSLKKSGTKIPRVELEEIGPSIDLVLRRTQLASTDLYKRALKVPKTLKPKKKKNISIDKFKTTHGRVHMQKQDLSNLQTRKMKGLKRSRDENSEEIKGTKKSKQETN
ncbi:Ribosome production factor 2-like [Holothuria leucospilota]|uniref:Ribosome production factor 2 homolog n=1 Tax=Holothuria leucospilota TaxID=206669 RepID=A0A9Q0YSQ5_HOLLE|nr:Ribosome production factor 2-like [Holothuria leucospilota]